MENNIHNTPGRALGKLAPFDRKSVSFGEFLTTLPSFPIIDTAPNFSYPMDGNDAVGDCVVAGWDHARQVITGLFTGVQKNFTQDEIWAFYKTQNPNFDPHGTAATNGPGSSSDCGMNIQIFLEYLTSQKLILGFAKIDQTNENEMKAAAYLGLAVITGVVVDQAQMGPQFNAKLWDYVADSPQEGGHCVPVVGYTNPPDRMGCVTWGTIVDLTQPFIQKQMDEAWFILMQEHVDHPSFRNHFDLVGFAQAVREITDGKIIVPAPNYIFTRILHYGMIGDDIVELQKRLATEIAFDNAPCFLVGTAYSTHFGNFTLDAVERYQKTHGLVSAGTWQTTGYGQLGPKTMTMLNGQKKTLIDAMIQVESRGDDNAEGDKTLTNHAYGCLQIRQGVVDTVNAFLKTNYKAQDCLGNRALSILIFNTYWMVYTLLVTDEDRAKAWNGGPGWKSQYGKPGYETYTSNLNTYWTKVQNAML